MDDPFALLGLPPDADERAVKRAYAAKLKTTRPDDDPEGFARLVAARDAALRRARRNAEGEPPGFRYRPVDVAALTRLAAAYPARPEPVASDPPADRLGEAIALAESLLAGEHPGDPDGWGRVFEAADALPLRARGRFETRLAEALNAALPRLPEPAATAIVGRVGEAFGWLGATRRVAGFFWPPDGRQPLPRLLERMLARLPPPARDANGLPILDPFDLDAFFGSDEHRAARTYAAARRRGRHGWGWNRIAFVSPAGWAALEGWYSAASLVLAAGLLLTPWLPQPDMPLDAARLAGLAALIVLHVGAGLAADRLSIARLVWHRRGADRISPYRDTARRRYLAEKTQRARAVVVAAALLFFLVVDLGPLSAAVQALSDLLPS
jgi:hypothetical protein